MADSVGFIHLHLHTEYSLADGLVRIGPLMDSVAGAGMPAVALTDYNNLFALVKFYRAAEARGIKPLIGVDLRVSGTKGDEAPSRVVLLCRNGTGYRNLTRLVTRAYIEGQHDGAPLVERAWLREGHDGLIALSAAAEGDVGRALIGGNPAQAASRLAFWQACFGDDYYLEVQRTGRDRDEMLLHATVDLALKHGSPVVATNDVRFLRREDFEAHEVRVCIHDGRTLDDPRRPRRYSEQQFLRTPREMAALFADLPEALENTVEIARRCNVSMTFGKNVLPEFPVPEGMTTDRYLREQAHRGLVTRLADPSPQTRRGYEERLDLELDVICEMGFPGYFLIVADFIQWAKDNGVPVGPGRGSGAGSLVAYALKITDLDPIRYDLLFERFLNPERVSMPDFDVDFCMEGRDRVIEYVAGRYGRERVSQIITYGSMAAKAVVRDVGRVLGHGYGFVDKIAKLIPFVIGMTLDKALEQEPELRGLYEAEEDVHAIIDMARMLEGLARNAGKHAGGVVISPSELTDFTPLYCEPGGMSVVTQLDKDDVEAAGLVKFDFLGLRTLTIIDWALRNIAAAGGDGDSPVRLEDIPLDDPDTFALLCRQETTAVFQLESRGIKEIIGRLQPDTFEDIIALVALYRPGPLQSGMVDDFILRKHGKAKVEYPHPDLEAILKPTYGVILYQEQVMQIAQVLAGYSLGGADLLRRAMGKKKPQEMARQREIFLSGATERGVEEQNASYIFDLMEKFAGYGFNRSHSAAYALLSYQTSWLKAHYPAPFMAAVLSADMDNTDKVVTLIDECRQMGLSVEPPDINRSAFDFTVIDPKTILYGLGAIKGVGRAAIEGLIRDRDSSGPFSDIDRVCRRGDSQKLNRRVLEALIRAGAMDAIGTNRATIMAQLTDAMRLAEQHARARFSGQSDLFGAADNTLPTPVRTPELPEWDEEMRLCAEKETLGLYLTGHPFDRYREELAQFTEGRIATLSVESGANGVAWKGRRQTRNVVVAGLVSSIRTRNAQSGRMAFLTLDDNSGRLEVGVFGDDYARYGNLIGKDRLLVVQGQLGVDEFSGGMRLRAREIMALEQARARFARYLGIEVGPRDSANGLLEQLGEVLAPFREGGCPVRFRYRSREACVDLDLDDEWRVRPEDELLRRLTQLDGVRNASLVY
ncbi:MAG: DNA polymerase III subunit alpha [Gammaproteobacteria bacterium]|nr:DNA polymerase III subunit alpha [Gammaproteobacteria bacterium]